MSDQDQTNIVQMEMTASPPKTTQQMLVELVAELQREIDRKTKLIAELRETNRERSTEIANLRFGIHLRDQKVAEGQNEEVKFWVRQGVHEELASLLDWANKRGNDAKQRRQSAGTLAAMVRKEIRRRMYEAK